MSEREMVADLMKEILNLNEQEQTEFLNKITKGMLN
jgi:hypothetical protein